MAAKTSPTGVLALHLAWLSGLVEGAALVVLKEHFATIDESKEALIKARQVLHDVAQVALEDLACLVVAGRVNDLRHVDDRRARLAHQDIERGEIAMNAAGREQQAHLTIDLLEHRVGVFGREIDVRQTRRGGVLRVEEQLHQEHVLVHHDRLRNARARVMRREERVVLHVAPALFHQRFAVGRFAVHRALVACIARLVAALRVARGRLERTPIAGLVDLGGDVHALTRDDVDRCLLAAHQAFMDVIDHAVFEQLLQAIGD